MLCIMWSRFLLLDAGKDPRDAFNMLLVELTRGMPEVKPAKLALWRLLLIMPAMMLRLFRTPSPLTSRRLKALNVSRMSSSVTLPNRTNMARANISRVHS